MFLQLVVVPRQDGNHVIVPGGHVLVGGGFSCAAREFGLSGLLLLQQFTKVLGDLRVDVHHTLLVPSEVFLQGHELVRVSLDLLLHISDATVVDGLLKEEWLHDGEHVGGIFPVLVGGVGFREVGDACVEEQGRAGDTHVI